MADPKVADVFLNGHESLEVQREAGKYFVAHEYTEELLDDYRECLEQGLAPLHCIPFFADSIVETKHILRKICEKILATDFGVYDISSPRNPNIFLELGIAIGLNVPFVVTRRATTEIPTVLQGLELVEYGSLKELRRHIGSKTAGYLQQVPQRILTPSYCSLFSRLCGARTVRCRDRRYLVVASADNEDLHAAVTEALANLDLTPMQEADPSELMLCSLCRRIKSSGFGIYHVAQPWDPVVFLQLGLSIGSCRPWLMVLEKGLRPPSDLAGFDRIEYKSMKELKTKLRRHARGFLLRAESYDKCIMLLFEQRDKYLREREAGQSVSGGLVQFNRGDVIEGTIVQVSSAEVILDVGHQLMGVVTSEELRSLQAEDPDALLMLEPGAQMPVYVLGPETEDGHVNVSIVRGLFERDWQEAERSFQAGLTFEAEVTGYNIEGLIIRLGRLQGFVPASQLVPPYQKSEEESQSNEEYWARMVGQRLQFKIIELDRQLNRLILSERAAMREWRKQQKEKLLDELQEGDVRRGRVSSLCNFGAFIDLGGADGLVHLSELSWGRVSHPEEVLQVGDEVDVYVLNVDREKRRIGLSIKRLQPEPWSLVPEKYSVGQLVQCTITQLANFGAFARLENDEIEGLIHISEISEEPIAHPKEVVKEGDVVTLRIIRIETERRRMGLSLKRTDSADYIDQD